MASLCGLNEGACALFLAHLVGCFRQSNPLMIITSINAKVMRSGRLLCHLFVVSVILSVRLCAGLLQTFEKQPLISYT